MDTTGVDPLDHLRARVERLEDERAILDAIAAYGQTIDAKDAADPGFVDCFAADGRFAWRPTPDSGWTFDVRGRAALRQWFETLCERIPPGVELHATTNARILSLDGDRAQAESWYLIARDYGGRPGLRSTGRYRDTLVRCDDGRWRIAEREATGDMPRVPAP
jgi:ketosteroid isomerase-like protein